MGWNIIEDLRPKAQKDRALMGKHKADLRWQQAQGKKDRRRGKPGRKREVK